MRSLLLMSLSLPMLAQAAYIYPVHVYVQDALTQSQGGLANVTTKVQGQIELIEDRLNTSGADFDFQVNSVTSYTGTRAQFDQLPPLTRGYRVFIGAGNNVSVNQSLNLQQGKIYFTWPAAEFGGLFGSLATDRLTGLMAILRGAIDRYDMAAQFGYNPINGEEYSLGYSWTGYPYGATNFDTYASLAISGLAHVGNLQEGYRANTYPEVTAVVVKDANNQPLSGATVKFYPVLISNNSVSATPLPLTLTSNAQGQAHFEGQDIFGLSSATRYGTERQNVLAEVAYGTTKGYAWLPLDEVQSSTYITQIAPYYKEVKLPVTPAINLGVNNTNRYIMANGTVELVITDFPNWQYSQIKIGLSASGNPLSGSVSVNGVSYGSLSGWYQAITIPQSNNQPIRITLTPSQSTHLNMNLQWWVQN